LNSIVLLGLWEQLGHLLLAELGDVSNVVHGLDLLQMHEVVNHPELVVVVHGNVQGLHSFGSGSTLGNCALYLIFSFHEICIFSLDLIDNVWGMDILLVSGPVDGLFTSGTLVGLVVVVQDRLELSVLFTRIVRVSCGSKSVQPFGGQFVV
jgi:hypothetical protein